MNDHFLLSLPVREDVRLLGVTFRTGIYLQMKGNRRVIVSSGWDETYPSYAVYQETKRQGLITEIKSEDQLAQIIEDNLTLSPTDSLIDITEELKKLGGATKENEKLIKVVVQNKDI